MVSNVDRSSFPRLTGGASALHWGLAAALITVLNALKPMHIDDPFVLRVAEQILAHPLNPFGFDIFWLQWPQPVYEELTAPVTPYWWALGLTWLPASPWAWKLWFFPFTLLLTWGWWDLLREAAPRFARSLLWATAFSPAVLTGMNLMQDIPAAALALGAFACFRRAYHRPSWGVALGAGLLAGLATQAKYNAVAILGAMALVSLLGRRWRLTGVLIGTSALLFCGWEFYTYVTYGQGMLLGQIRHGMFWVPRSTMALHAVTSLGGVVGYWIVALLGDDENDQSWTAWAAAIFVIGGTFSLAWLNWTDAWLLLSGLLACICLGRCALEVWQTDPSDIFPMRRFALLWVMSEIGVYFLSAPFPAVRRVLGLTLAGTLLVGVALQFRWTGGGRALRQALVTAAVTVGLLFYVVDWHEARNQKRAVDWAASQVGLDQTATVWFLGHWGFQYYAEQAGFLPLIPDRSEVKAGDWIVQPVGIDQQSVALSRGDVRFHSKTTLQAPLRLATGQGFYGGGRPLSHARRPGLQVRLLRARNDFPAQSGWPVERVANWARRAGGQTALAAEDSLRRFLGSSATEERRAATSGLLALGNGIEDPERLWTKLSEDRDPEIRLAAALWWLELAESRPDPELLERLRRDPDPRVAGAAQAVP